MQAVVQAVAQVEASAQEEVQAGAFHLRVRGAGVQAEAVGAVSVVLEAVDVQADQP